MWEALQETANEHRCKCLAGQRKHSWIRTRSSSNEGSLLTMQAAGVCMQAGPWLSGKMNTALTVPTGERMIPELPSWPQPGPTGAAWLHLPAASHTYGQRWCIPCRNTLRGEVQLCPQAARLRPAPKDSRTLLLHTTVLPSSSSATNPRFAHLNQSYRNLLLKKTTQNANI